MVLHCFLTIMSDERTIKLDYKEWNALAERSLVGARSARQIQAGTKYQHALKRVFWRNKADMFIEAAEAFRICGRFQSSSDAYTQAASIFEHQLESHSQAAILYTEAGLCLEKLEVSKGSDSLGEKNK